MVIFKLRSRLEAHQLEPWRIEVLNLAHVVFINQHLLPSIFHTMPYLVRVELSPCLLAYISGSRLERLVRLPVHLRRRWEGGRPHHLVELYPDCHVRLQREQAPTSNPFLKLLVSNAVHQLRNAVLGERELGEGGVVVRVDEDYVSVEEADVEARVLVGWLGHGE